MADPLRIPGQQNPVQTTELQPVRRPQGRPETARSGDAQKSFSEFLRTQQGLAPAAPVEPMRFSAHARTRLESRQIALDGTHLDRLDGAVRQAASKGSRDALVLMDDLAMVVSVRNRTVVTVVDRESMKQNVFTNIDSAVIA